MAQSTSSSTQAPHAPMQPRFDVGRGHTVGTRGQYTISSDSRKKAGITPGTRCIDYVRDDGIVCIVKLDESSLAGKFAHLAHQLEWSCIDQ